jgi:hypothetical protein
VDSLGLSGARERRMLDRGLRILMLGMERSRILGLVPSLEGIQEFRTLFVLAKKRDPGCLSVFVHYSLVAD